MLENTFTVESIKRYYEDVKEDFPSLNFRQIVEDYIFCQFDCLVYESQLDFPVFIDSTTKLLDSLYNETTYTTSIVDELTKQFNKTDE